jgi:TRAP-type C4-dicarboxylate transport system substrate-binding protein
MNTFVKLAALASAMTLISTAASAQTKWDLAAAYPESNYHSVNLKKFAEGA